MRRGELRVSRAREQEKDPEREEPSRDARPAEASAGALGRPGWAGWGASRAAPGGGASASPGKPLG